MSLRLVGEVTAAGKRLGDFQEEVSRLYKTQLKNSEVMVSLEASAIPVYVTGAVGRPGRVSLDRPMTVLEAIMEAGGLSNLGTLKGVVVIRNMNGQHLTQTFDLSPALKGKKVEAFYLKPYDMINVPERFF
jgi:polysaccharide export outer membrane protein